MSAPAGQSCVTCLFCVAIGVSTGECRFSAPVYQQPPPPVAFDYWCGKWYPQPTPMPTPAPTPAPAPQPTPTPAPTPQPTPTPTAAPA